MNLEALRRRLPRFLERYVWHFENAIERAVSEVAAAVEPGARVLDAGAGEGRYRPYFRHARYVGLDLGVGDASWDYSRLDVVADLSELPFAQASFDAAINIVTLEHVREPARVMSELGRVLRPGGRLLLVAPQDWEVHQAPNDYYRYTRYGLQYLLQRAGFEAIQVEPCGGYFRLMGRRLLNGVQFFRGLWLLPALLLLVPAGLVFPVFDKLDRHQNFTLGYICRALKAS